MYSTCIPARSASASMAFPIGPGEMRQGFTLIELMVVMVIVSILLSIVAPRYFDHLDRARQAALQETLAVARDAIDKFHGDTGRFPLDLQELVARRYLRALPVDPISERNDGWVLVPPPGGEPGIADLRSASVETEAGDAVR